jgi:hypothetical protein
MGNHQEPSATLTRSRCCAPVRRHSHSPPTTAHVRFALAFEQARQSLLRTEIPLSSPVATYTP